MHETLIVQRFTAIIEREDDTYVDLCPQLLKIALREACRQKECSGPRVAQLLGSADAGVP